MRRFLIFNILSLLLLLSINAAAQMVAPQSFSDAVKAHVQQENASNIVYQWHDEVNGAIVTFYNTSTNAQKSIRLTNEETASLKSNTISESVNNKINNAIQSIKQ